MIYPLYKKQRIGTRSDWLDSSEYRFDWLALIQSIFAECVSVLRVSF